MDLLKYGNIVDDRNYFMGASPHRPDVGAVYDQMWWTFMQVIEIHFTSYYNSGEEDSRNIKFYATGINATSFYIPIYRKSYA